MSTLPIPPARTLPCLPGSAWQSQLARPSRSSGHRAGASPRCWPCWSVSTTQTKGPCTLMVGGEHIAWGGGWAQCLGASFHPQPPPPRLPHRARHRPALPQPALASIGRRHGRPGACAVLWHNPGQRAMGMIWPPGIPKPARPLYKPTFHTPVLLGLLRPSRRVRRRRAGRPGRSCSIGIRRRSA